MVLVGWCYRGHGQNVDRLADEVDRQIRNSKHEIRKIILLLLIVFCSAAGATTLERGVSLPIAYENLPDFEEVYRIRIENKVDGAIEVSRDAGENWEPVGKVLYPTDKVSANGYSASKWMAEGRVVATSVNAIHIKSGSAEVTRTIFSILPKEMLQPPRRYRSYISPNSSIYTDIPAGTSIFGGGWAPFVGNVVLVSRPGLPILPLDADYVPGLDDTFYILVDRPLDMPREIVFENRFGGRISISYFSGDSKVIGQVLRPVSGVGRFEGSKFVDPGRVRANHAGCIDVSVSPLGKLGGFQIVPALHGSEMTYIRRMTQWMVIGPVKADDPSIEGMAPFYKFFIQPNYRPDDLEAEDWQERLLSRYLVEVRYEDEEKWQPMPIYAMHRKFPLPYWADRVFDKVSHFRILFPIEASE